MARPYAPTGAGRPDDDDEVRQSCINESKNWYWRGHNQNHNQIKT